MNSSGLYHPPPPPTDGPNTRQRSAAGLPPVSGSTAPLPTLDELDNLPPWSAVSHEFDQPLSAASFYPTPALAGCDVFSPSTSASSSASVSAGMNRVVSSTDSIVDYGSPQMVAADLSNESIELPDFAIDAPTGSSFGFDFSSFPATASPAEAGFGLEHVPEDIVTPSPHMTMTKEEWLKLGGFTDDALTSSAGPSSRAQPQAAYTLPPPPVPQGYREDLSSSTKSSYGGYDLYGSSQWTAYSYPENASHLASKPALAAPSSLAGWAGNEHTTPATTNSYTFPSPPASQTSPARDRTQSRRAQARTAPSPSIQTRRAARVDPYPTTAAVTAFEQEQQAEADASQLAEAPPPAPTPAEAVAPLSPASEAVILPPPANTTRKSHARKASVNHIPRPRNAFILFRSSAVTNNLIPTELGLVDHKNISKVIGEIWRGLGDAERAVWEKMAQVEKSEHARKYPNYQYKPKKREDRIREKEEEKERARANAAKPPRIRNRSVKKEVQQGEMDPKAQQEIEWDDKRCRATAQAVLEGAEDEKIVAKVEQVLAEQGDDELGQGSSQETVALNRDILVDSTQPRTRLQLQTQQLGTRRDSVSVFTLPASPHPVNAQTRISPPRPPLVTARTSPADVRPTTASPQFTPHKQPQLLRRAHSSSEGSPNWPSPTSSISSSSTASPSSAQRLAQQQRLELPTPTRGPHPFSRSPITGGKLEKQQSLAMAGLGISAPGGGPPEGAFARGASQWTGSTSTGPSLPSLASIQPEGGFDNSPLLGGAAWGAGAGRVPSLGRWELRLPSQSLSSRELAAQAVEEEYTTAVHARGGSDQSIWGHGSSGASGSEGGSSNQYGTLDPSEFLEALVDDTQSEAPSWDSGHQPSSQSLTSSSHSSQYSNRMPSYTGLSAFKDGRVPSFHLGGQDLFAAPSGDALFGAPPPPPGSSSLAMSKMEGRTVSGILGMVAEHESEGGLDGERS